MRGKMCLLFLQYVDPGMSQLILDNFRKPRLRSENHLATCENNKRKITQIPRCPGLGSTVPNHPHLGRGRVSEFWQLLNVANFLN